MELQSEPESPKTARSAFWFVVGMVSLPAAVIGFGRSLEAQGVMKIVGLLMVLLSGGLILVAAKRNAWASFGWGLLGGCAVIGVFIVVFVATFSFPE